MKKILFGIFAHPDDEAFGPAAALISEVEADTELHLILLTAGENGTNPDNLPNLGEVRLQEWRAAGELIGATSMQHLGYIDGTLNNLDHLEVTDKIIATVSETIAERDDIQIEFMSLDLNGFTGHIDHIVAARSACLAFYRLRAQDMPMSRIRLFCWSKENQPHTNTDFVYMEPGRTDTEIDETIDGTAHIDKIHDIMRCHETQRGDYEWMIAKRGDLLAINHFIVKD